MSDTNPQADRMSLRQRIDARLLDVERGAISHEAGTEWMIQFFTALIAAAKPEKRGNTALNSPSFQYYEDKGHDEAIDLYTANIQAALTGNGVEL